MPHVSLLWSTSSTSSFLARIRNDGSSLRRLCDKETIFSPFMASKHAGTVSNAF